MILIAIIILITDQVTKYYASKYLKGGDAFKLIKDFFQLRYVENSGAAFGILEDGRIFFIIVTIAVMAYIFYFLYKKGGELSTCTRLILGTFIGGTLGNFIDRLRFGYVIDFLSFDFGFYKFPVFNVADIAITISVAIFAFFVFTGKVDLDA